jgi:NADH-quinone oxidoreductase subunit C
VADATAAPAESEEAAADTLRRPLLELLEAELGDDLVGYELSPGDDLWVRVDRRAWRRAAELCRDRLGMRYFCFLSGIDWKPNPDLLGEKAWEPPDEAERIEEAGASEEARVEDAREELEAGEVDAEASGAEVAVVDAETPPAAIPPEGKAYATGVAGGDTRFQVFARLYNTDTHVGITLKADLDDDDPHVDSLVPLFRGADWHEREAWEMYGFVFDGHPGLRHLYLPGQFEGHPLRKDFPLLARIVKPWPGLVDVEPIPGEDPAEGEEA